MRYSLSEWLVCIALKLVPLALDVKKFVDTGS